MIPEEYYPLCISLGYILLTIVVCRFARIAQSKIFSNSAQNRTICLEFISTFELLAIAFELGVVLVHHGFPYYAGLLIILLNYWGSVWPPSNTSPHPHIVDMILGSQAGIPKKVSLLKILAQLGAAAVVFNLYVKPIWSFGTRVEHLAKLEEPRCFTNLKSSTEYGTLTEAGTVFVFAMAGKLLGPRQYSSGLVPFVFVGLKRIAMPLTGCFMNPVLASTIQFGCEGVLLKEHILVYWLGPVLGLLLFRVISKVMPRGTINLAKIAGEGSTSPKKSIKTKNVSNKVANKKKEQ